MRVITAATFSTVLFSKPLNQRKLASSLPESGTPCSASSSTASRALCHSGPEAVDTLLMGRVAAAALQRAQAGGRSGGPRPFGYEDDGITVREAEAEAVRVAVESVLAGRLCGRWRGS